MAHDGLNKIKPTVVHDDSLASGDRAIEVNTRMYGEDYEPMTSVRTVPGPDICYDKDEGLPMPPGSNETHMEE